MKLTYSLIALCSLISACGSSKPSNGTQPGESTPTPQLDQLSRAGNWVYGNWVLEDRRLGTRTRGPNRFVESLEIRPGRLSFDDFGPLSAESRALSDEATRFRGNCRFRAQSENFGLVEGQQGDGFVLAAYQVRYELIPDSLNSPECGWQIQRLNGVSASSGPSKILSNFEQISDDAFQAGPRNSSGDDGQWSEIKIYRKIRIQRR